MSPLAAQYGRANSFGRSPLWDPGANLKGGYNPEYEPPATDPFNPAPPVSIAPVSNASGTIPGVSNASGTIPGASGGASYPAMSDYNYIPGWLQGYTPNYDDASVYYNPNQSVATPPPGSGASNQGSVTF